MREHESNATAVATFLEDHDAVRRVFYPGLGSHPQHDLAAAQMSGYGGMLSFELDGSYEETLAEHPASMTHNTISQAEREQIGISDSLVRLSVGVEHIEDLVDDLAGSLARLETA